MTKSVKFLVLLLVMILPIAGALLIGPISFGAELSKSPIVDKVELDHTTLYQGEMTSIKVSFSDKENQKIKPGDTITLTLPGALVGMTENDGSPRKINLNGLGEVFIYKDHVVATFNEKVESLHNVNGHFSFGIKTLITNSSQPNVIETDFGTATATQRLTIEGVTNTETGQIERDYPFFYKVGDLAGESNQVRWFLNVNLNKSDVTEDISIADRQGSGQQLNKESFTFDIVNDKETKYISLAEFEQQGYGKIDFVTDNDFNLRFYRDKARFTSFIVRYTSTITEAGQHQATFENSYDINYQLNNQDATNEKNTSQVKNVFVDGEASGNQNVEMPTEESLDIPLETIEEWEPKTPTSEQATETSEKTDTTETAESSQPEVHVSPTEEENPDESETLGTIEPIIPEKPSVTTEENGATETAESSQPEVHVSPTEENPDESEALGTIEPIIPEKPSVTTEENGATETAESSQPEVHVSPTEEENPDESETLGTISPIIPEKPSVTTEENGTTETAESSQPEVHVSPTKEITTTEKKQPSTETTVETNKTITSKNQPQILNVPLNTVKNEGSPQLAPQLLSEPIQKLNEANGQRELPKTGTTKTPFMLIAGILASTFAVLGVSYLQIRKN
ncbi:collagen binding domain-containing protein [Enterococcus faecalis]|uniref:collagen binding domain-containing protein n=1 Tax=Enterococcus faecalis TaxID=1351 RepID=UPI001C289DD0|nr:collagen binding domain-containing protein [Enterococcus faecalis]MDN3168790.1 collagen binding domain-containing protein [Enterococcus faecalis]HBG9449720.1 LPXTG cell wall anchor domain-containing protein [Enterococcus faecalis]HCT4601225.1 LPXTG cell wall anchor domain-containing protein [Enterococcus faecalis]HCT6703893.1 LPXTG cell wall anchor domain-containing protein [Enterococcus faecalis]HCT7834003.1 LPXTG cell wall anchor domain-containing protein [Enterococcus faecalis]